MPHFLFIAEIPPVPENSSSITVSSSWILFEDGTNRILKSAKAYKRHQKNVWLLPVENAWHELLEMSNLAKENTLAYTILLLEDDPIDLTGHKPDMKINPNTSQDFKNLGRTK